MGHEAEYNKGTITNDKTGEEIQFIYHESIANIVNYVINGVLRLQADLSFDEEAEYNEVFDTLEEDTSVAERMGRVKLNKEGLEGKIKFLK